MNRNKELNLNALNSIESHSVVVFIFILYKLKQCYNFTVEIPLRDRGA